MQQQICNKQHLQRCASRSLAGRQRAARLPCVRALAPRDVCEGSSTLTASWAQLHACFCRPRRLHRGLRSTSPSITGYEPDAQRVERVSDKHRMKNALKQRSSTCSPRRTARPAASAAQVPQRPWRRVRAWRKKCQAPGGPSVSPTRGAALARCVGRGGRALSADRPWGSGENIRHVPPGTTSFSPPLPPGTQTAHTRSSRAV
jgi:hypothetical protein